MGENMHTNQSYQVHTIRMSILLRILMLAWPILIKDIYFGLDFQKNGQYSQFWQSISSLSKMVWLHQFCFLARVARRKTLLSEYEGQADVC